MSYLFPRNIGGFSVIESLLINELQIQTQSVGGLTIYQNDPTQPLFTINGETGTITTSGTLEVLGTAIFNTIDIQELKSGLLQLASENATGDLVDIGIYGQYNPGTGVKFSAVFRNTTDSQRRWFFVENFDATPPISNIPSITTSNFSGIVVKNIFTNNGTFADPSYSFYSDPDTGLYLDAHNTLGFSAGNISAMTIKNNASVIEVKTALGAIFYNSRIGSHNDIASSQGGVTTGSIILQATGTADKWHSYISTNPVSAYSGEVFSFGLSSHYFLSNANGSLTFSLTTETLGSATQPPDYRHGSKANLLTINNSGAYHTIPIIGTLGSGSAPTFTFSSSNSGMYMENSSTLSFSVQTVNVLDMTSTYIYPKFPIRALNGTSSAPVYSFNADFKTGIYRDPAPSVENISFTLGGNYAGRFIIQSGISQLQSGMGTAQHPSYGFLDTGAGIFSPTTGGATQGLIGVASHNQTVWVFKNRSGNIGMGGGAHLCLNALEFYPDSNNITSRFDSNSSKILNFKSPNVSINGYDLINVSVLAFYRFDDQSNLGKDSSESSSQKNAIVIGPPLQSLVVSDGTITKKYVLDLTQNMSPTNMYLSMTHHVSDFSSVNDFTLSFWFRCGASQNGSILNFKNTSTNKNITIEVMSGSDALRVTIESNSLTTLQFNTQSVLVKNNLWHHVVLQLGSTGNSLYYDNVKLLPGSTLIYTSGGNGVPTPDYSTNTLKDLTFNRITMGGQFDGVSFSNGFTGYLYSMYMSASYLTVSQINTLYREGTLNVYSLDVGVLNVGNSIISGQILGANGNATSPGFSFSSDPDSGMFRGINSLSFSYNGTEVCSLGSENTWANVHLSPSGLATTPTYSFSSDTDSGMYLVSTGVIGISTANVQRMSISSSAITVGSGIQILTPDGSVSAPSFSFTNDSKSGLYRIGTNNIGLTINELILDLNTTRVLSSKPIYYPNGSTGSPSVAFNTDGKTGLYYSPTNTAIYITNDGINNARFERVVSPSIGSRLVLPQGSLQVPSLTFDSATNTGFFYNSSLTSLELVAGGVSTITSTSTQVSINVSLQINNALITNSLEAAANGTASAPAIRFSTLPAGPSSGLFLNNSSTGILSFSTNSKEAFRLLASAGGQSYAVIGNITDASSNVNPNTLRFAGVSGKQDSDFSFTVLAERIWAASSSELLLFKNINSSDRIRHRAFTHIFQAPTVSEIYTSLLDDSTVLTITNNKVTLGINSSSATQLELPNGSATSPSLLFLGGIQTGIFHSSTNTINITSGGSTVFQASSAGISSNVTPFTIKNGSSDRVTITNTYIKATSTQTLLNSIPVLEYLFLEPSGGISKDNSINNYTGGVIGSVGHETSQITLNPLGSGGLINYFAASLSSGSNGIFTNTHMAELTNAVYLNITIKILFTNTSSAGNCWVLYGNHSTPSQNYIRLHITSGGILNVQCLSGSTTIIQATYSSVSANIWYTIEFVTTPTDFGGIVNNFLMINGTRVTMSYSTGSSSTLFSFQSSILDKTSIRAYVGGGINSYNAPPCYINYFSIIQTSSTDMITSNTYRQQIHELYTNKLVVSGYPYDNVSTSLNEGFYAISNKIGQIQWDNSIQVTGSDVFVNTKELNTRNTGIKTGAVKYNYQISASSTLDLTSDTTGHFYTLTAGTVVVTLPTGSSQSGREYVFTWKGTPGSITFNRSGSDTIGGIYTSYIYNVRTNTTFRFVYDGQSDWIIL